MLGSNFIILLHVLHTFPVILQKQNYLQTKCNI